MVFTPEPRSNGSISLWRSTIGASVVAMWRRLSRFTEQVRQQQAVAVLVGWDALVAQQRQSAVLTLQVLELLEHVWPFVQNLLAVACRELLPRQALFVVRPEQVRTRRGVLEPHIDSAALDAAWPQTHDQHAQRLALAGRVVDAGRSEERR